MEDEYLSSESVEELHRVPSLDICVPVLCTSPLFELGYCSRFMSRQRSLGSHGKYVISGDACSDQTLPEFDSDSLDVY